MAINPTISTRAIVHPGVHYQQALENAAPTDFWGRANSYRCPLGAEPGRAWLLLLRSDIENLSKTAYHELIWKSGSAELKIKNLVLTDTNCMDLALAGNLKAVHLCEFQDVRATLQKSSINSQYNVRIPAPSATSGDALYYTESTNGGTAWTWQTLLDDIWGNLPTIAGTAPTLPYSPDGTPEGFRFIGVSAWAALHEVLRKIHCTTALDPTTTVGASNNASFSYVQLGTVDPDLAETLEDLAGRIMYDYDPVPDLTLAEFPATIRTFFMRREEYHGIEKDTIDSGNWEMAPVVSKDYTTGITGAAAGTVIPVWDDLPALTDDTGAVSNDTALQTRADEIGEDLVDKIESLRDGLHRLYQGIVLTVLPGSEITSVTWRDYGDDWGLVTEIERDPIPGGFSHYISEHLRTPDLSRNTHPLYPRVCQPVKPTSSSPNGSGLYDGTVQRWAGSAWASLESCWIKPIEAGVTSLPTADRYVGRLSGVETDTGDTRPVYLVNCAGGSSAYTFEIKGDEGDQPTVTNGDLIDFDASGLSFTTEANSTVNLRGIVVRVDDNDPTHDVSFAVDKSVCQYFEMTGSWTGAPYSVLIRDGTRNAITIDASAGNLPPIDITGAAGILTIAPRNPFWQAKDDQGTPVTVDVDYEAIVTFESDTDGHFEVSNGGAAPIVKLVDCGLPIGSIIMGWKAPIAGTGGDAGKYFLDRGGVADKDWALMDGNSNASPGGSGIEMVNASGDTYFPRAEQNYTVDATDGALGRTPEGTPGTDNVGISVNAHPDHRHEITTITCDSDSTGTDSTEFNFTTDPAFTGGAIQTGSSSPITLDHTVSVTNGQGSDIKMVPPFKGLHFFERIAKGTSE